MAATSAEFIFSTSALPPSGVDCASPSTASILAPPSALMPPAALISSIAMVAPSRPCWPEYDSAPDTGCRTPTFTAAPCARDTTGALTRPTAATAPNPVECRNRRRLTREKYGRDIGFLPLMTGRETNISPMGLAILACLPPHTASAFGMTEAQTLIDKLWAAHEIVRREDGDSLLWVDRHYVHEGSFHAFSRLAERSAAVAEPGLTFGVADHYVPTRAPRDCIGNPVIARMVRQMDENAAKHRIKLFGLNDRRQGIVHVVGPEQGLTLPGLLIVCGDSHTSTHGALGAFAFGIGASEVAHVLMTQTIWQLRPKRMRITVDGKA